MIPGKKVQLLAFEPEHIEKANTWVNDLDIQKWLTLHQPVPLHATKTWYKLMADSSNDHVFAIFTKRGKHIGNIGLHKIDWKNRNTELGICIGEKGYLGRGYGEDAIRTLLRFAFDELSLHRVCLHVFAFNDRAKACYKKCGFKEEGIYRDALFREGAFHDAACMGILDHEFRKLEKSVNAE